MTALVVTIPRSSSDIVADADLPLHRLVALVQRADRDGVAHLWLTGRGAAAVAARLLRLARTVRVGIAISAEGLRGRGSSLAIDAVARDVIDLAAIGGGVARVLVTDPVTRARLGAVLRRELAGTPRTSPARFGGDAFTATIRLPWSLDVELVAGSGLASAA